ncbi:hypothetical protein BRARA_K00856 [Brassica rapa]|uniref:Reverse transcriptase zinc-binding domain-containing protein n=1 Tax=Brassica campestris TaxID=3711 RepID=A0A397KXB6_BRACM|nr:hypothetical protein BRARA_K00856 [Brassica rapa]
MYKLRSMREDQENQQQQHLPAATFDWQKFIWRETTSPKLKIFLWRLCRGALPLGANLRSRGINTPGLCPHCNEDETALHLFFLCPFATQVWERAPYVTHPNFSDAETLHDAFLIMSTLVSLPPIGVSTCLTSWLLWNLWTARNLLVFENRQNPAATVVSKACSSGREWLQAQVPTPTQLRPALLEFEIPPTRMDVTLCNSDAAWSSANHRAGLGWCFTDLQATVIQEQSRALAHISSPLVAEALAMREAMLEAKRRPLTKVWFRTDSRELARAIYSKSYPVELFGVLMDIEILSSSFIFCFISFVGREHNAAADSLAKAALSCFSPALY